VRINWFSPLPPAKTEIAAHTARILPALAASADVTVWTDHAAWEPALERVAPIRRFTLASMPWHDIDNGAVNIYQIGNNHHFHAAIWQVSRLRPGVIAIHDWHLHYLFAGMFGSAGDREGYLRAMERYHGSFGLRAGKRYWQGRVTNDMMAEHFPLTPLASENALGVLTHTRDAFRELKRQNRLPVDYAPLPYPIRSTVRTDAIKQGPPFRLILFGYIGPNRRLDSILQALAQSSDQNLFHLDIYGDVWDPNFVATRIKLLGLTEVVKLHGFVPEPDLEDALDSAHLALNLRQPTMGEASASQLRIWDHALPTLVTRLGWYAGLPQTVVSFVRPENEVEDIQSHLRAFAVNPSAYVAKGQNGRRLLKEGHRVDSYVDAVMRLAKLQAG
jgi:glycosyltransferase involved in cell wall biosynthesis